MLRKCIRVGRVRPANLPKAIKLRGGPITPEEIEAAIALGRD